jgi:LysR family hydrogen peroxide-inducible transcriptional activator
MDLRALRYFVAAVETGSITAASGVCHVAQPSITMAVSRLEDELGVILLLRGKRGVQPTSEGRELFIRARRLLVDSEAIVTHFRRQDALPELKISQEVVLSLSRMSWILHRLKKLQPNFRLLFSRNDPTADLYVCRQENVPESFRYLHLWEEDYCLLLPEGHSLAGQQNLLLSHLQGLPLVERTFCEMSADWQVILTSHQLELPVVARCDDEDLALTMVEAGIGATLAPCAPECVEQRRIIRIPLARIEGIPAVIRRIGVAVNPRFSGYAAVRALFASAPDGPGLGV